MIRVLLHTLLAAVVASAPLAALAPEPAALTAPVAMTADPAPVAAVASPAPVYVRVIDWRRLDRSDVLGPACAHLRIKCEPTVYARGAVTVVLTDPFPAVALGFPVNSVVLGVSSGDACEGRVWAISDVQVVAHELGHALGLDHVSVEGNLLYPSRDKGGMDLTADQRRAIRHGARVMRKCA